MKIIVRVGIGILAIAALGLFFIMKDIPKLKALPIESVSISSLQDGTYEGNFEFSRWKSDVKVSIKNGQIVNIERLSEPLTPDVSTELSNRMIEEQKVDVDVVTGATASSKAYMKSVENALSK